MPGNEEWNDLQKTRDKDLGDRGGARDLIVLEGGIGASQKLRGLKIAPKVSSVD
jgi:hypothetical protein